MFLRKQTHSYVWGIFLAQEEKVHQRHLAVKTETLSFHNKERERKANLSVNQVQIVEIQTLVACSVWRSPPHLFSKVERRGWQRSDLTLNPPETSWKNIMLGNYKFLSNYRYLLINIFNI